MLPFVKAHAYGNDFLYVPEDEAGSGSQADLARSLCDRHLGIGADGLILYRPIPEGARMRLFNADGSRSEVSGNGVRGLAAIVVAKLGKVFDPGRSALEGTVTETWIETEAGTKHLTLLDAAPPRYTFRAAMGMPTGIRQISLEVAGHTLEVSVLSVGNPQCVVLERSLSEERMRRFGPALEQHPAFPEGTNVEFAVVEAPDRVRILIWERGVGPTMASGTGACAAAVAAAAHGGASRNVTVISPGGAQHVEWWNDELFLTGWAEIVAEGTWLP